MLHFTCTLFCPSRRIARFRPVWCERFLWLCQAHLLREYKQHLIWKQGQDGCTSWFPWENHRKMVVFPPTWDLGHPWGACTLEVDPLACGHRSASSGPVGENVGKYDQRNGNYGKYMTTYWKLENIYGETLESMGDMDKRAGKYTGGE